jgi:predicted kinase
MTTAQKARLIEVLEQHIRDELLSFDDLQTLSGQAYAKEAAQDSEGEFWVGLEEAAQDE